MDERYERYVRDRLVGSLLEALVGDKDAMERHLADSLLKLVLGRTPEIAGRLLPARREAVAELKKGLIKSAPSVRLLDQYRGQIRAVARSRKSSRKLFDTLLKTIRRELKRRRGYNNDSYHAGVLELPKALQREMRRLR